MWKYFLTAMSLMFAGIVGAAVTIGGYSLDDPELEAARLWASDFKYQHPEQAREIGRQCRTEIGRSPWTRDGAFALFQCIRAKAEARGAA